MTTIHFIGQELNNGEATGIYHLTINGRPYTYSKAADSLKNEAEGYEIIRESLPADVLRAFHEAWDPDAYKAAMVTPPLNEYGIPEANEDPKSPLYYPVKPQGEPMELRQDHVTTVDLTSLITKATAKEDAK